MDNQALRPDNASFFRDFTTQPEETKEPTVADPEDQLLAAYADSEAWRVVSDYINQLEKELDLIVTKLMESGATFQEIGQKTAVKEVTKSYLEKVKAKVSDAKEAVERANG